MLPHLTPQEAHIQLRRRKIGQDRQATTRDLLRPAELLSVGGSDPVEGDGGDQHLLLHQQQAGWAHRDELTGIGQGQFVNANAAVTLYDLPRGTVSGIAPRAYIAAYKAVGPYGGMRADLTAAIEKAVADGVDVINYSLGSDYARDPWKAVDAQAFLGALEAGVFVVTANGNDGPDEATVGAPANAPWVTSVGASYANRIYLSELTLRTESGATLTDIYGASITPGITDFRLVRGQPLTEGACMAPFAAGSFQKNDAIFCRGGGVAPLGVGDFVHSGGAGALLLYNPKKVQADRM